MFLNFHIEFNSYIHRRDLHTVLPKHAAFTANNSPRLSKTMTADEKINTNNNSQLKRSKLTSVSSDPGLVVNSNDDEKSKRHKSDETNESSSNSSESYIIERDAPIEH